MQINLKVRLETDSTSATGICQRRGVGRLRHLHKRELWLQDCIAEKTIELGRVPSEENEADLGTKYLEKEKIRRCLVKMGMIFAGAWAGNQMPVAEGAGIYPLTIGPLAQASEDKAEFSWMIMATWLLAALGMVQLLQLLWAFVVIQKPAVETKGKVTEEQGHEVLQTGDQDRQEILAKYSDQQLWELVRGTPGLRNSMSEHFLQHCKLSKEEARQLRQVRLRVGLVPWVAGRDDYLLKEPEAVQRLMAELEQRPARRRYGRE